MLSVAPIGSRELLPTGCAVSDWPALYVIQSPSAFFEDSSCFQTFFYGFYSRLKCEIRIWENIPAGRSDWGRCTSSTAASQQRAAHLFFGTACEIRFNQTLVSRFQGRDVRIFSEAQKVSSKQPLNQQQMFSVYYSNSKNVGSSEQRKGSSEWKPEKESRTIDGFFCFFYFKDRKK